MIALKCRSPSVRFEIRLPRNRRRRNVKLTSRARPDAVPALTVAEVRGFGAPRSAAGDRVWPRPSGLSAATMDRDTPLGRQARDPARNEPGDKRGRAEKLHLGLRDLDSREPIGVRHQRNLRTLLERRRRGIPLAQPALVLSP